MRDNQIHSDDDQGYKQEDHYNLNKVDDYLPYHIKGDSDEDGMDYDLYAGLPMPIQDNEFENEELSGPI